MKKQLRPAGKKGFESAGENDEIIDLDNLLSEDQTDSGQDKEDVLDLTDEISSHKQESLQAGIIELTEKLPSSSYPKNDEDDNTKESSDNVIRLSDMTSNVSSDESDDLFMDEISIPDISFDDNDVEDYDDNDVEDYEEIDGEAITDLDEEDLEVDDNSDLAKLTEQLESAMANPYEEEEEERETQDRIEKLPEANLIEVGEYHEDEDQFDLLPENEPGMADNIDTIDMDELEADTAFAEIEHDLTEEMAGLSNIDEDRDDYEDDPTEEELSDTALELSRAIEESSNANALAEEEDDDDDGINEDIDSIRTKLDKFFPEEDTDPLAAFDSPNKFDQVDEDEDSDSNDEVDFNPEELVLPPFDENESGAPAASLDTNPFEIKATPVSSKADPIPNPFAGNINFYDSDDDSATLDEKFKPFEAEASVNGTDITSAVEHLIETKYSQKIEKMIAKAIEKVVSREMAKIKRAILDGFDQSD